MKDLIKDYMAQSFDNETEVWQFVNTYRINEAIEVLSDASQIERPLKQLWSELGFTSPSTFYKLFQQSVGITPLAFRKLIPGIKKPTAQQDDTD